MLATRLPGVLPPLDDEQALEVTAVHSVAGMLDEGTPLVTRPPFVDPHHSASLAAVVGGGSAHDPARQRQPRPPRRAVPRRGAGIQAGGVGCAAAADGDGCGVVGAGVGGGAVSGAVPVGLGGESVSVCGGEGCRIARCAAQVRRRYLGRLSGPLMDRVDIRVDLAGVGSGDADSDRRSRGSRSAVVAERVLLARERAAHRWRGTPWRRAAEVPGAVVRRAWRPMTVGGGTAGSGGADGPVDRTRVRPGVAVGVDRGGSGRAGSAVDRGCGDGVGVAMRGDAVVNEAGSRAAVALAGLLRVCEPPSAALAKFVQGRDRWRPGRRCWRGVRPARWCRRRRPGRTGWTRRQLVARAQADLAVAAPVGARLIGPEDASGRRMAVGSFAGAVARGVRGAGPPLALYVRGRPLAGLPDRAVTVVGSRASSAVRAAGGGGDGATSWPGRG